MTTNKNTHRCAETVYGKFLHKHREPVTEWSQLKCGDHILQDKYLLQLVSYEHHAIVVSVDADKKKLLTIGYSKISDKNRRRGAKFVILESEEEIEDFGNLFFYIYHESEQSLAPEEVVKRARSRIGEKEYNLLSKNCEHFATWCKTGIAFSRQVEIAVDLALPWPTRLANCCTCS